MGWALFKVYLVGCKENIFLVMPSIRAEELNFIRLRLNFKDEID
jgi:hypothetical protein